MADCIEAFFRTIHGLNLFFKGAVVAAVGMALFLVIKRWKNRGVLEKEYIRLLACYLLSMAFTVVYLVLLCAKVGVGYLTGSNVFSGILLYVFLMAWVSIIYIVRRWLLSAVFTPIVAYVLVFATVINVNSYNEFNISGYDARTVKAISDDIVAQVTTADKEGRNAVEVYVPVYGTEGNWPISTRLLEERLSRTLCAHGIIKWPIKITVIPMEEMNKKYHLN